MFTTLVHLVSNRMDWLDQVMQQAKNKIGQVSKAASKRDIFDFHLLVALSPSLGLLFHSLEITNTTWRFNLHDIQTLPFISSRSRFFFPRYCLWVSNHWKGWQYSESCQCFFSIFRQQNVLFVSILLSTVHNILKVSFNLNIILIAAHAGYWSTLSILSFINMWVVFQLQVVEVVVAP